MPPRPRNRVLCTCLTHKCGEKEYWNDGAWHRGNLLVSQTAHRHQLDDQASRQETQSRPSNRITATLTSSSNEENDVEQGQVRDNHTALAAVTQSLSMIHISSERPLQARNVVCDTSRWMISPFKLTPPVFTYAILIGTMFSILQPISNRSACWLLGRQQELIQLTLQHRLQSSSQSPPLTPTEKKALEALPSDSRSCIKWLNLEPILLYLNCCSKCFATYPLDRTPNNCYHSEDKLVEELENSQEQDDADGEPDEDNLAKDDEECAAAPDDDQPGFCGQPLFCLRRSVKKPIRQFAYQSLSEWIGRLFTRPGIEDALDQSLTSTSPQPELVSDIHGSKVWAEFAGPDGQPFTRKSGNLIFGLFIDAINPYGNKQAGKHASITFIVLVCMSLPYQLRFLPENIFLVGIAPGPKEPSLTQTNWILKPIVVQLNALWTPGLALSQTHRHPEGRHIHAALVPCFADLPALRRALGFPGHSSNIFMCSICDVSKSNITNLDTSSWNLRTSEYLIKWAHASRDAETFKDRAKIFKSQGVRYSVLTELPYWKPAEYQTVDAMHNLLLGLFKWHCMRFWSMSEKVVNEDYLFGSSHIPREEVEGLVAEAEEYEEISDEDGQTDDECDSRIWYNLFGTNTSTNDTDWQGPDPAASGWGGRWTAPPEGDATFDLAMLRVVNSLIPRIHYPTWIKRAIPVLGKASNGKLKADEWRNLFQMQLPLIMVKVWYGKMRSNMSLLQNFAHLVSAVNLALKRSTSPERINSYSHHMKQYLASSIILFPHCKLAPNHHMAMHLGECLARFGPVRAWWSFPMERLMGDVLRSTHNNRLGELEITFLKNFGRAGNLRAMLNTPDLFPENLKPSILQLQKMYEPKKFTSKYLPHPLQTDSLSSLDCRKLVDHLNAKTGNGSWAVTSDWTYLSTADKQKISPLSSRCQTHKHFDHNNVTFSTWQANQNNSIIAIDPALPKQIHFARIETIFTHTRTTKTQEKLTETWLKVKALPPIPPIDDIFNHLRQPDLLLNLRLPVSDDDFIISIKDVLAHCAWIEYKSGELYSQIKYPVVALVTLDRE